MLTLLATALAQDEPPESERTVDVGAPRFVLVVEDLGRTLQGRDLSATVGDRTYALRDDGKTPDPVPDDGLYAANIDSQDSEQVLVRIDAGDELLDQREVTISADLVLASVRVDVTASGVSWRVQEDRPVNNGAEPVVLDGGTADGTPDTWTAESDRMPSLSGTVGARDHTLAAGAGLALSAVLGGLLLARTREDPVPQSQGEAPGPAEGDAATVARAQAQRCNVLLVPEPGQRGALAQALVDVPSVVWLDADRPNPHAVARAAGHLADHGPMAVVVQGPGALEAPGANEAADAALEELRELAEWPLTVTS